MTTQRLRLTLLVEHSLRVARPEPALLSARYALSDSFQLGDDDIEPRPLATCISGLQKRRMDDEDFSLLTMLVARYI